MLPKSPVAVAIQYLLSRWSGFTLYCTEGILSIDNNLAERTLRPCAIGRKNYLFVGSDRGGQAAAVHYSLMASCKANEVEPFAYLRDVLSRITDHATDRLEELLPDQWLKQHPEAHYTRRR
ncbi:IS66 family transposase [Gimesia benthica]